MRKEAKAEGNISTYFNIGTRRNTAIITKTVRLVRSQSREKEKRIISCLFGFQTNENGCFWGQILRDISFFYFSYIFSAIKHS